MHTSTADVLFSVSLRDDAYIEADKSILCPEKFGLHVLAFVEFKFLKSARPRNGKTVSLIQKYPNVQEIHHMAGEFDLIVKIRCRTPGELLNFIDYVQGEGNIDRNRSVIVLETIRETTEICLDDEDEIGSMLEANEKKNVKAIRIRRTTTTLIRDGEVEE